MNALPTEEEVRVLLGSARALRKRVATPDAAVPYDRRRPDRVAQAHVRSLQLLHERFARNLSSALSAYLRVVTETTLASTRQVTYAEFLQELPDPTAFYAIAMRPLDGIAALEINPAVAFAMMTRMLGGSGSADDGGRALTEIEQNIVDSVVNIVLENLSEIWRSLTEIQFQISGRETRPQMRQVAAPHETVLALSFDIRIGEVRGGLNLCIPAQIVESIRDSFAQTYPQSRHETTVAQRRALARNLAGVRLPVVALLESSVSARDLLDLRPGDVLSLGRLASHPVSLVVEHTRKFEGHLTRRGSLAAVNVSAGPLSSDAAGEGEA